MLRVDQDWMDADVGICRKRIGKLRLDDSRSFYIFQGFFMADSHVTGSCRLRKVLPLDRLEPFAITY